MIRSVCLGPCLVFTLFFASVSWAQAPPGGVVIQTWHYDPATGFTTIRVNNVSGKSITAFDINLVMKFADGTKTTSDSTTELLPLMVAIQGNPELGSNGDGSFAAGTSYDKRLGGPGSKAVVDLIAVVDMVAYADGTADVQNKRAFDRIVAKRQGDVLAMQKINDTINQSLTSSNPKQTALAGLGQLNKVASDGVYGSDEETAAMNSALRIHIPRLSREINTVHKNPI
jgi:hypothetical protein